MDAVPNVAAGRQKITWSYLQEITFPIRHYCNAMLRASKWLHGHKKVLFKPASTDLLPWITTNLLLHFKIKWNHLTFARSSRDRLSEKQIVFHTFYTKHLALRFYWKKSARIRSKHFQAAQALLFSLPRKAQQYLPTSSRITVSKKKKQKQILKGYMHPKSPSHL